MTSPANVFKGKTRRQEKAEARAARRDVVAAVRRIVFERAGGKCERCATKAARVMHHVLGGSGRRRQQEAVGTCVALCVACHAHVHAHPRERLLVPCATCGEPWCPRHADHYARCGCPGTNGEEPPTRAR